MKCVNCEKIDIKFEEPGYEGLLIECGVCNTRYECSDGVIKVWLKTLDKEDIEQ